MTNNPHVCPQCGSTNITYDFVATVSVAVVDGVIQHIVLGGILGAELEADQIWCGQCGGANRPEYHPLPRARYDAIEKLVGDVVPTVADEVVLYQKEG